ncbi:MAG: hypothetical protein M3542_13295, partial [Acidobacteriota bacterium]|nr:hypothetical protein [Acidobacteriota bacterium]
PELFGATLAVWAAVAFSRAQESGSATPLLAAGALLALLPWLSVRYWMIVGPMGLAILIWVLSSRRARGDSPWRRAAWVLLPGLVSVSLFCLFGLWWYQKAVPNPGYFLYMTERRPPMFTPQLVDISLLGLFFDRAFGLLPTAPVYLLAFAGIAARWKNARRLGVTLLATAGVVILFAAVNQFWYGGWAPPSRYIFPAVALLAPFAACVLERWSPNPILKVLAGWSVLVAIVYTAFPETRYSMWDGTTGALSAFFAKHVGLDFGAALPTFIRADPFDYVLAAIWGIPAVIYVVWLALRVRREQPEGVGPREDVDPPEVTEPSPDGSTAEIPSH